MAKLTVIDRQSKQHCIQVLDKLRRSNVGCIIQLGFMEDWKRESETTWVKRNFCTNCFDDPYCERKTHEEIMNKYLDKLSEINTKEHQCPSQYT